MAKADPYGVRLSGAEPTGSHELAGVDAAGERLSLGWSGALPEPVLEANRATYVNALPDVDLVLQVDGGGVETFLVVKNAAAVDRVRDLTFPISGKSISSTVDAAGNTAIKDGKGRVVARSGAPVMWDAKRTADTDSPARVKAVASQTSKIAARGATPARVELNLTPDAEWMLDVATTWPVTIDPQINPVSLGGDLAADADGLGQLGHDLVDQSGDLGVEQADLVV